MFSIKLFGRKTFLKSKRWCARHPTEPSRGKRMIMCTSSYQLDLISKSYSYFLIKPRFRSKFDIKIPNVPTVRTLQLVITRLDEIYRKLPKQYYRFIRKYLQLIFWFWNDCLQFAADNFLGFGFLEILSNHLWIQLLWEQREKGWTRLFT